MFGTDEIPLEQALFIRNSTDECRLVARSSGFSDEWVPVATRMCAEFGARPAGVACPSAVFARPLGKDRVAIVQVADLHSAQPSEMSPLGFRYLIINLAVYIDHIGDPFVIAERFPPHWHARGDLPTLDWPSEPLPRREVAEIQRILQRASTPDATPLSPLLLGATQALVDGSPLVFERPAPDTQLIRDLWNLLPHSTRNQLWPASFAFDPQFDFDVVVVPHAYPTRFAEYLTEEQADNYPQGRYELRLQLAVEAGDQQELDAVFARRSRAAMFRFGFLLLFGMLALLGLSKALQVVLR